MADRTVTSRKAMLLQQKGREFAAIAIFLALLTLVASFMIPRQLTLFGLTHWFPDTNLVSILLLFAGVAVLLQHSDNPRYHLIACTLAIGVAVICLITIYMQIAMGAANWSVVILGHSMQWPYQKIAFNTLFDLILVCCAILCAKMYIADWVVPRIIAVVIVLNILFVLAMYINNANFFLSPMPITTSAMLALMCLFFIGLSLMTLQPVRGAIWVYASTTMGGVIARRASLFILILPVFLSIVMFGLKSITVGYVLEWMSGLFVLNVLLLILFVVYNAQKLAREERYNRRLYRKNERLQSHLQAILDYSDAAIYVKDLQGHFVVVNKKLAETFEHPQEYFIGKTTFDFLPEEDAKIYAQHDVEVQHLYQPINYEESAVHPDGSIHMYLSSKFALRDKNNIVYGMGGIATDITDRKTQENKVKQSEEKLKRINQELEAFSYSVSHDLRAPLRAIDGFGRALKEELGDKLDTNCQEYLNRMMRATEKMSHLIDDLLRLSKVSRQDVTKTFINLSELCDNLFLEKKAWGLNASVDVMVERNMQVEGDLPLVQVMMDNLISNALKFTSKTPQPKISVQLSPDDKRCVMVMDNGVGFDEKYQNKLFKVFQRLHRECDFPGTGIGLAIVSRIAEKQGITVWAESMPNLKTVFYLKFP